MSTEVLDATADKVHLHLEDALRVRADDSPIETITGIYTLLKGADGAWRIASVSVIDVQPRRNCPDAGYSIPLGGCRPEDSRSNLQKEATCYLYFPIKLGAGNDDSSMGCGVDRRCAPDGSQTAPKVGILADGGVVVVWQTTGATSQGIRARRFSATGAVLGEEIAVASGPSQSQHAVAGLSDGSFYITWTATTGISSNNIEGRVYGADGTMLRYQPVVFANLADHSATVAAISTGAAVPWTTIEPLDDYVALRLFNAGGGGGVIVKLTEGLEFATEPSLSTSPATAAGTPSWAWAGRTR